MFGDVRDRVMKHTAVAILDAQAGRGTREETQPCPEADRIAGLLKAADPLLADSRGDSEEALHGAASRSMFPGERTLDAEEVESFDVNERWLERRSESSASRGEELASAKSDLSLRDAFG